MPYAAGTWTAAASTWNPAVAGTAINASDWITLLADISTGLSTCILKDGSQTATALVPFAAGLSAGAAAAFNINSSGVITTDITMNTAASRLIPGATSFSHRNNANNADNLLISDAGAVTVRNGLTVTAGNLTFGANGPVITTGIGTAITWTAAVSSTYAHNSAYGFKIGGTAGRASTEGTNKVDIYDGTAPVGTMANGISLYSTAGELRVMDAAGNATLLSPHDDDGLWIYDSTSPITGKHLRVHMEKLLKAVNDRFGWDFVEEHAL